MNTAAIRDALLDVIQRPKGEMMAMGQRGKTLIAERYTWRIVAQKSLMLYEWLLGRGERPDFVVVD
jgi:poly(glycerol-phosphate) alpha-glucosyltransferase